MSSTISQILKITDLVLNNSGDLGMILEIQHGLNLKENLYKIEWYHPPSYSYFYSAYQANLWRYQYILHYGKPTENR